ncbi:hypothetical protein [Candidatus Rhabdochlamydia porcellionis]|jgi:hypothetical protein|uniref:Peptidase C39 domain-containing protein n=1 Tax=Candidatus Rhabdochlamydia porcellionis TaxID=225148 RepID=A0ABX8YZ81_9BACT|nr:hypothetical protein [Candidatus Rhabdochlamydia porcellionis]QZA58602.1 hypothetical protein RHAB15C_0000478 [Candidatus Rhabdochlamydia porcellionis]
MTMLLGASYLIGLPKIFQNEQVVKSSLSRRYPPIGRLDTIEMAKDAQGKTIVVSIYRTCSLFKDEEILKHHAVIKQELIGKCFNKYKEEEDVYMDFTENGKAIIQQQATRGCTAAVAAMLIKDQKGKFNFYGLSMCNLGDNENIKQAIRAAGFKPIVTRLALNSLKALKTQLLNHGSAIVSIVDPKAGGHSIVVDEVSEDLQQVRLRDPYHGWEITVSAEAFQVRWTSLDCTIIQIENKSTCVHFQEDYLRNKALKV